MGKSLFALNKSLEALNNIYLEEFVKEELMREKGRDKQKLFSCRGRPEEKFKGTGRNEICPCGSGKKYKKCCLEGEENEL